MSDLLDVMESTDGSGATMTRTLYEYGEGSLGEGIRRLAGDMLYVGYERGAQDMAPVAYDAGITQGRTEGMIVTLIVGGIIALGVWGTCKLCQKKKTSEEKSMVRQEEETKNDGSHIKAVCSEM